MTAKKAKKKEKGVNPIADAAERETRGQRNGARRVGRMHRKAARLVDGKRR